MEEEKTVGLVETFDTGELSTELIPPNFTDPDDLFEILKKTVSSYHPSNDLDMINKAYELAKDAHKDQKRKSGEPYLIHPVCVAYNFLYPVGSSSLQRCSIKNVSSQRPWQSRAMRSRRPTRRKPHLACRRRLASLSCNTVDCRVQ